MLLDVQHDVEADRVHQAERAVGHAQHAFENRVDLLGGGDLLGNNRERLALDGRPDAIEDEADAFVAHEIRLQAELRRRVDQRADHGRIGLAA